MRRLFTIISLVLMFTFVAAQDRYFEAGAGFGISNYSGDLSPSSISQILGTSRFSGTGYIRYNLSPNINFKLGMIYAGLEAKDSRSDKEWQVNRNFSFYTDLYEIALTGELNLFKYAPLEGESIFTIYLMGGIGGFHFNPRAQLNGQWYELQKLGTEGQGLAAYPDNDYYSLYELAIPFGGGLKFKISESVNFNLEMGWRLTFTDYLDDVSGLYPDYYTLLENRGVIAADLSNRTAEALGQAEPYIYPDGTKRGNPDVGDYYFTLHIGLSYNIINYNTIGGYNKVRRRKSNTTKCPSF